MNKGLEFIDQQTNLLFNSFLLSKESHYSNTYKYTHENCSYVLCDFVSLKSQIIPYYILT